MEDGLLTYEEETFYKIQENEGITYEELVKDLNYHNPVVIKKLKKILSKFLGAGYIRIKTKRGTKCFYLTPEGKKLYRSNIF